MFNSIRARRKGFLFFTTAAVLLTVLFGYLLMHRLLVESVQSIQHSIDAWRPVTWLVLLELALGQGMIVKFVGLTAETIV